MEKRHEKDFEIRDFAQKTQSDTDMQSMVPPLWSRHTFRVMAGVILVLAIIGGGVIFWS